ncbi:uncharacterized protein [Haliotis asinina]|uniref:uncharacterized protein isoform X1 n=1 Tax=Haliotis asinina TaxID=109174 RepID=UPI0035327A53
MIRSFIQQGSRNSSPNALLISRVATKDVDGAILTLGKRLLHHRKCLCLGATSVVAFLVLSRVPKVDSPSDRALHTLSVHRHREQHPQQADTQPKSKAEKPAMSKPELSTALKRAKEEALWGLFVGDAISMPVHWYYNPQDIKRGYGGWLTKYEAPNKKHPSSIMSLSNIGGSGRGGDKVRAVIGDVILHDKLKYWAGNNHTTHYHQGMKAGDSTLNAVMALEMMRTFEKVDHDLVRDDRDVRSKVLEAYVKFMTTPGTHGDTYAESFHRSFFKDWSSLSSPPQTAEDLIEYAEQRYKQKTKGSSDHQLVVIGALVPAIPWVLRSAHRTENECAKSAVDFIKLTHPETALVPYIDMYARLLHAVLNGHDLKTEAVKLLSHSELGGPSKRDMVLRMLERAHGSPEGSDERLRVYQSAVANLGLACYIEGAISSLLYLAVEFSDDFEGGVLANANVGGENCHRGAALGALLGAAAATKGKTIPQKWKDGLGSAREGVKTVISQMNK